MKHVLSLLLMWLPCAVFSEERSATPVRPSFFENESSVTVGQLIDAMGELVEPTAKQPAVLADYEGLLEELGLSREDVPYHDYVRLRIAFEATRDGGLWHLRWDITDEQPSSKRIWDELAGLNEGDTEVTAVAECDELSALFAFVVHRMGVRDVGLFWPTTNHTVAVWTVGAGSNKTRIVVPNSQIFLTREATLGTREFDPWSQRTIYEYTAADVPRSFEIPGHLARFMMDSLARNIHRPATELQGLRNARAAKFGGS